MKKLLTLLVFVLIAFAASAQTTCPANTAVINLSYTKPVTNGQVIGKLGVCDEDTGQLETWSITLGNTAGLFTIVKDETSTSGLIKIANATAINAGTVTSYAITVKVQDNGSVPASNTTSVIMTEKNSPPVIFNQTLN